MFVGAGPFFCWLGVAKVMTGICPTGGLYCWYGEAWWFGSRSHNQDEGQGRGGVHVLPVAPFLSRGREGPSRDLGNLSHLPEEIIDVIRAMLAGRRLVDLDEDFQIERSLPHGHVAAVLGVLRDLDLERLLGRDRCRERDLVVAMIVQRLIAPGSKLSATRRFSQTTLAEELDLGEVKEAELLAAMDWLVERRPGSSGRSRAATCPARRTPTRSCSMTCPRATWRVAAVRWRGWATRAKMMMEQAACQLRADLQPRSSCPSLCASTKARRPIPRPSRTPSG